MPDFKTLSTRKEGSTLHVWLNRPDARNAWNREMNAEFEACLDEAENDDGVSVLTLRGKGPVFSAGHDLKELAADIVGGLIPKRPAPFGMHRAWYFSKPVVAGVHGYVGPFAWYLLANLDFIIAVEGTRFSFEDARRGTGSPGGSPLVMHFPPNVWKKLQMVGGWMTAEQAFDLHFVSRVVRDGDSLDAEVERWAAEIEKMPIKGLQAAKIGIHRQYELMGLAAMQLVQSVDPLDLNIYGPAALEWAKLVEREGLKVGLRDRDVEFDPEQSRI